MLRLWVFWVRISGGILHMPTVRDLQNGVFELDYRDEKIIFIKHVHQTRLMLDRVAPPGEPVFLLINCTGCEYDVTAQNLRLQNSVYKVVSSAYIIEKERQSAAQNFRDRYGLGWQAEYFEDRQPALEWILKQTREYSGDSGLA